ncbi:IclR family transcriptional regulator domain-containing protein [Arthrobacter sp. D2-10]
MQRATAADADVGTTNPDYVESMARGLAVLRTLAEQDTALSVTEIATQVGITRTAARRFALTLEYRGYANQSAGGYTLSPGVLSVGDAYLRSNPLPDAAHPCLRDLVRTVRETASLTVLHHNRVYFTSRVVADRIVAANITVGSSIPAYSTATGRVLLGGLNPDELNDYFCFIDQEPGVDREYVQRRIVEACERGWAVADQELVPGIRSVAVPVHNPQGQTIAALNIVAHATRVDTAVLENRFVPLLQSAAQDTAKRLLACSSTAPAEAVPAPAMPSRNMRRPPDAIQSLERGLEVLTCFDAGHPCLRLAQIAERCQIPRSAVRRFVLTLSSLGYLAPQARGFALTPQVLGLGYSLIPKLSLADVSKPYLEELARKLGAFISIGILEGANLRYIATASSPSPMAVNIYPGTRIPAAGTAMGQVLLSLLPPDELIIALRHETDDGQTEVLADTLETVRIQGWSYVDQLLEVGLRAIAVPLQNRRGEVVAALSASVHEPAVSQQTMASTFLPALRETAAALVTELRDGLIPPTVRIARNVTLFG